MARPPDVRAVGRRVQPGQQVLRREALEQGVDDLKIHAFMAQGKLAVPDKRALDGNAARKKHAVGRVHRPIDRTADLRRLRQRSDDQTESADELCVANRRHPIAAGTLPPNASTNAVQYHSDPPFPPLKRIQTDSPISVISNRIACRLASLSHAETRMPSPSATRR